VARDGAERRTEERVRAALPVGLGNVTGVTRDVSASGVYFETAAAVAPGQRIKLGIAIDTAGGQIALWCQGIVLRVDKHGPQYGVAARLLESEVRAQPAAVPAVISA